MYIRVTPAQLTASSELFQLAMFALANGCGNKWDGSKTSYYFDQAGSLLIQKEHLDLCYSVGAEVDKAVLYYKAPASMMDNLVPVDLPMSKWTVTDDDTGEETETRRIWSEYCPDNILLEDGDYRIRLAPVSYPGVDAEGKRNNSGTGLSAEWFRLFYEALAGDLMTKAEGEALVPKEEQHG